MNGGRLQEKVIDLAHYNGWRIAHFRSIKDHAGRWQTPIGADGKGFPDLVLVHPRMKRTLFREIKGAYEQLRPDQVIWGSILTEAGQDWAVWRPRDFDEIITPALTFGRGVAQ